MRITLRIEAVPKVHISLFDYAVHRPSGQDGHIQRQGHGGHGHGSGKMPPQAVFPDIGQNPAQRFCALVCLLITAHPVPPPLSTAGGTDLPVHAAIRSSSRWVPLTDGDTPVVQHQDPVRLLDGGALGNDERSYYPCPAGWPTAVWHPLRSPGPRRCRPGSGYPACAPELWRWSNAGAGRRRFLPWLIHSSVPRPSGPTNSQAWGHIQGLVNVIVRRPPCPAHVVPQGAL